MAFVSDIIGDMKLVLDTDVVVAAMRSGDGASAELIRLAAAGRCTLLVSVALVLEYEAVTTRPDHLNASRLDDVQATGFIDGLIYLAEPVPIHFRYRPVTKDPADELVLEAAVNGGAAAIITFNRRDFGTGPSRFGIGCWLPREALEKLR